MEISAVTLLNTMYRRNIKSAGTLRHAYMFSTSCYQRLTLESWFTNLETNATQSLSTVTGTVQTIYSVDGLKQNSRRWNDWPADNLTNNIKTLTEYFFSLHAYALLD